MPGRHAAALWFVLPVLGLVGCTQSASPGLTAGYGVTLSSGEVSVDPSVVQTRVSGGCETGMVMKGVNEDGSAVCIPNGTVFTSGEGVLLQDSTLSVEQTTIEAWARGVAFDSELELAAALDAHYLAASYVPSWNTLTDVPADLADGDDDTQYTAGAGISLSGNTFSVDTSATQARVTGTCGSGLAVRGVNADGTVSCGSTSDVGPNLGASRSIVTLRSTGFNSPHVTLGEDGFPLILHHGTKLIHCGDKACRSFSQTNVLNGQEGALTMSEEGLPIIAFRTAAGLSLARCADASCTSATSQVVDAGNGVGQGVFVTLGDDGLPLMSYREGSKDAAKLARCNDADCTTASIQTLESGTTINQQSVPVVVGIDGMPVVAYRVLGTQELKVVHCDDAACSSFTSTVVGNSGSAGYSGTNVSLALGADGLPVMTFSNAPNGLYFAHCDAVDCSSVTVTSLMSGTAGAYSSVVMGSDGLPLVSFESGGAHDLNLLHCGDASCTRFTQFRIDGATTTVGTFTGMALGADGMANIAYRDEDNGTLKFARVPLGRGTQRR